MDINQSRLIDAELTNFSLGYQSEEPYIGKALFPEVEVGLKVHKIITFHNATAEDAEFKNRAPGANVEENQFEYETKPFDWLQDARAAKVPLEDIEAGADVGFDLKSAATRSQLENMAKAKELWQAKIACDPTNYPEGHHIVLEGANQFDHPEADPITIIKEKKETVRRGCGRYPNTIVFSPMSMLRFERSPKIIEQYKGTVLDEGKIAEILKIKNVVVGAATSGNTQDAWGDNIILAYVAPLPASNNNNRSYDRRTPSFGYTYQRKGRPFVRPFQWERGCESYLANIINEYQPYITFLGAGVLFSNTVSQ